MEHPTTCFGLSRHNVIIPLIVTSVADLGDGRFEYSIELNHSKPTKKEILEQRAELEREIKDLNKQLDVIDQSAKDYE